MGAPSGIAFKEVSELRDKTETKILFPELVGAGSAERRNQLLKLVTYIETQTRCKFQPSALEAKRDLSNFRGVDPDTNKAYATRWQTDYSTCIQQL